MADDSFTSRETIVPVILSAAKNLSWVDDSLADERFFAALRMTGERSCQVLRYSPERLDLHQFHAEDIAGRANLFQCPFRNGIVH